MKKSKKANKKMSNMAAFVVVIMLMFMSIISIEIITIIYSEKIISDPSNNNLITTTKATLVKEYNTDSLKPTTMELSNRKKYIESLCEDGCDLKVPMYGEEFYYIIRKGKNEEYILNIVKDNKIILENRNLGYDIDDAYFINYQNYILFYNIVENDSYRYDYAIIVDNRSYVDEFSSLDAKEMEFTENGIIYYYDVCYKSDDFNAKKIKAIRNPFSKSATEIGETLTNYTWCNENE